MDQAGATSPRVESKELGAIAVGGALGALARVALSQSFPAAPGHWPWVTFTINLAGAFLLGYILAHLQERHQPPGLRQRLLTTGFCSTFTTFSTVQLELLRMIDLNHLGLALLYVAASVAGGYLAVLAGSALGHHTGTR